MRIGRKRERQRNRLSYREQTDGFRRAGDEETGDGDEGVSLSWWACHDGIVESQYFTPAPILDCMLTNWNINKNLKSLNRLNHNGFF